MYELNYTFSRQSSPSQYSEETDEVFYDTDEFEYTYEVSNEKIANAIFKIFGKEGNSLEQNTKTILSSLMNEEEKFELLKDYDATSIEEVIVKAKEHILAGKREINEYTMLDVTLGDIYYYAEGIDDTLRDYFEEEAAKDLDENYEE